MEHHPAHTGGRWVVDEMQLDAGGQQYWIWNVMDRSTGYLLASHLTKERDARSALAVLKKAAAAAAEPPRTVRTDRWPYYVPAVKQVFPDARHLRPPGGGTRRTSRTRPSGYRTCSGSAPGPCGELVARRKASSTLTAGRWTTTFSETTNPWTVKPPGQAAKVNPPFNEWADVVKGRANPKSADPAGRTGETSMRVEIPAGVDVAPEVDSDPRPQAAQG